MPVEVALQVKTVHDGQRGGGAVGLGHGDRAVEPHHRRPGKLGEVRVPGGDLPPVDGLGRLTGKPSLLGDGMRVTEFVYADQADDDREAADYERMFRSLLASPWFLGGCVCEYRAKMPTSPFYSPRPDQPRTGIVRPKSRWTSRSPGRGTKAKPCCSANCKSGPEMLLSGGG